MINKVKIVGLTAVFVTCTFCKKDFEVLNCHSWRYREKLKHQRNKGNHGKDSVSKTFNTVNLDPNDIVNNDSYKCICGEKGKRL